MIIRTGPRTYLFAGLGNCEQGQKLIFTLTGTRRLWVDCTKDHPEVSAEKPVSVFLIEASLRATPYPRNDMDVLSARPINLR